AAGYGGPAPAAPGGAYPAGINATANCEEPGITKAGRAAFEQHLATLQAIVDSGRDPLSEQPRDTQ
ncbi:transcriptional regulator, partial [Rhodococcus rhodochrous]|nr:transcriptional regulator [Rhodococcus rhodochrous]